MDSETSALDFWNTSLSVIQPIDLRLLGIDSDVQFAIKREDLLHPFVSGNKFRKLKYNIAEANFLRKHTLATFGGAFSNHIAAVAFAGSRMGFNTIGFIRGEELASTSNPTLDYARSLGMQLFFISRASYKDKDYAGLSHDHRLNSGDIYWIPEGGTNHLAVKGCEEILDESTEEFDFIGCCVGTAGTISGLINSQKNHQKVLGFPALKGGFLTKDICKFVTQSNWALIENYHFGGYGKIDMSLIAFMNQFYQKYQIPLDPVYTGKMMFGLIDLIKNQYFPEHSKILAIHSGGLQGIAGMNDYLKGKKMPLIEY